MTFLLAARGGLALPGRPIARRVTACIPGHLVPPRRSCRQDQRLAMWRLCGEAATPSRSSDVPSLAIFRYCGSMVTPAISKSRLAPMLRSEFRNDSYDTVVIPCCQALPGNCPLGLLASHLPGTSVASLTGATRFVSPSRWRFRRAVHRFQRQIGCASRSVRAGVPLFDNAHTRGKTSNGESTWQRVWS
jgi:hypothetical protein